MDELSPQIFRDYINYLKYDAPKYDGHKYIQSDQGLGLSDTTINIRLRVYRAMFNFLDRMILNLVSGFEIAFYN
ncbi:hypothetical protein V7068_05820 [Bacillus sp. JJ634]